MKKAHSITCSEVYCSVEDYKRFLNSNCFDLLAFANYVLCDNHKQSMTAVITVRYSADDLKSRLISSSDAAISTYRGLLLCSSL